MASLTMSEKILARVSGKSPSEIRVGDVVTAKVDLVMSHDNAALISTIFKEVPVKGVRNPQSMVVILDHRTPAPDIETATKQKIVRDFVREQKIPTFYNMNEGICHQVLPEKGHVLPGMHIVGTDSHSCTYGAFGAFGYGVGATEMAAVWAAGDLWLRVPETMKITVNGRFRPGVYEKDMTLSIIGDVTADGANYMAVEYYGETIRNTPIPGRMTLCNMGIEMGAKVAMVPPDEQTFRYLAARGITQYPHMAHSDPGARFAEEREYDINKLVPQVACPHSVDNVHPIDAVKGKRIDQAFLGSCTNGRIEDLHEAASILKGRKVHPDVRLIVTPASKQTMLDAMNDGTLQILMEAGAVVGTPGCGPCMGAAGGILAPNERCISSSNRNFKGRMGHSQSEVYLGSPATVAASAIKGEIADPREFVA
ncbi:MAG TPA: 3-isopropylmalate dehydratase large subunit [Candidatus Thermoplasmatota archaeon]|nr:3-isopropylmalate dehydratase large subunit [Candidatus Thermoplasmatota archaeon]